MKYGIVIAEMVVAWKSHTRSLICWWTVKVDRVLPGREIVCTYTTTAPHA